MSKRHARQIILTAITVVAFFAGFAFTNNLAKEKTHRTQQPVVKTATAGKQVTLSNADMLAEVNKYRAEAGIAPLSESKQLNTTAMQKCQQMLADKSFGHEDATGTRNGIASIKAALPLTDYRGENLAANNFKSGAEVIKFWYDDLYVPDLGHRVNMLNSAYMLTGFAVCSSNPNSASPSFMVVQHLAD